MTALGGVTLGNQNLIVGIDPGTTVGLAFLDLEGDLALLKSGKNMGFPLINRAIVKTGNPLIISTDVSPPPRIIERVSSTFSAKLIHPKRSLGRREKNLIVNNYCRRVLKSKNPPWDNRHEKDALASAVFAWKGIRPTIKKIRDKLQKRNIPPGRMEEFIRLNVLTNRKNINLSIREFLRGCK